MIIMRICYSKSNELIYLLDECPICFYQITNKNKFIAPCCLKIFCQCCIQRWQKNIILVLV